MQYFEVKERLSALAEFLKLYREYIGFTNRWDNVPAEMLRKRMQPMVPLVVDSLRRVGLGDMVSRDAASRGGKKLRINLIKAIFRERLIRHFNLDDRTPLTILERGVVAYQQRLWRQRIQLFNPLFWLFEAVAFLARLPLFIAQKSGVDTETYENSATVRAFLVLAQVVIYLIIARSVGMIDIALSLVNVN